MSYRGLQSARTMAQQDVIFEQAGQPVIWRTYVSSSGGVAAAGFGATAFYAERVITALIAAQSRQSLTIPESQTPGGQIANAELLAITRQPIGRNDELRWRGVDYRVESDPVPARITQTYVSLIKRIDS